MEKLENIEFDKEDKELFLIDDLELKAKAIRFSVLPKFIRRQFPFTST